MRSGVGQGCQGGGAPRPSMRPSTRLDYERGLDDSGVAHDIGGASWDDGQLNEFNGAAQHNGDMGQYEDGASRFDDRAALYVDGAVQNDSGVANYDGGAAQDDAGAYRDAAQYDSGVAEYPGGAAESVWDQGEASTWPEEERGGFGWNPAEDMEGGEGAPASDSHRPRPTARPSAAAGPPAASGWPPGGAGGEGDGPAPFSRDDLAARIKQIQRVSAEGKESWGRYCDASRTGRDPMRHTEEFLQAFLDAYDCGEEPVPVVPEQRGSSDDYRVVKLRGLPYTASALDIADFLAEYSVSNADVVLRFTRDGRPSGEAFVSFATREIAEQAIQEKHKAQMRSRYIELFLATPDELERNFPPEGLASEAPAVGERPRAASRRSRSGSKSATRRLPSGRRSRSGGGGQRQSLVPSALKLRGIPFRSQEKDIADFLRDYGVSEKDVVIGILEDGRPSGEAIVIFSEPGVSDRAEREMQRKEMGTRYIEIFPTTYDAWLTMKDRSRGASAGGFGTYSGGGIPASGGFNGWGSAPGRGYSSSSYASGGAGRGAAPNDREHDELVARVKAIQRSGEDEKAKWWRYCESHNVKVFDPARHDANFLQAFLAEHGKGSGRSRGRSRSPARHQDDGHLSRTSQGRSSSRNGGLSGIGAGGPISESQMEALVRSVKEIQRAGDEEKRKWWRFCDMHSSTAGYDPRRHRPEFLRDFLVAYNAGRA
mmetsp:Transcript_9515/g.27548  ORF Transcript_9515/g.27548 Transcript_9515/m.27548 type:complete len:711 (-) Transcript_9515:136-2268(-)